MTVYRQVNLHHKHISIASNFFAKLCETRFEIKKLNLVLDSASFYKKRFLVGRQKFTFDVSHFRQMLKAKK